MKKEKDLKSVTQGIGKRRANWTWSKQKEENKITVDINEMESKKKKKNIERMKPRSGGRWEGLPWKAEEVCQARGWPGVPSVPEKHVTCDGKCPWTWHLKSGHSSYIQTSTFHLKDNKIDGNKEKFIGTYDKRNFSGAMERDPDRMGWIMNKVSREEKV